MNHSVGTWKSTPEYLVRVLCSRLSDRTLLVGEGHSTNMITCGINQRSKLASCLWTFKFMFSILVFDVLVIVDVTKTVQLLEGLSNSVLAVSTNE